MSSSSPESPGRVQRRLFRTMTRGGMRSLRRPLALVLAVAVVAVSAAWLAPMARAHAGFAGSTPPDGSVIAVSPASIELAFGSRVTPGDTFDVLRNRDRSEVVTEAPYLKTQDTIVVPLPRDLERGDYSVRWSVVSADGHPMAGTLAFRVGTDASTRPASVFSVDNDPRSRDLVGRWLFLLGVLTLPGVLAFRHLVWLPGLATMRLSAASRRVVEERERVRTGGLVGLSAYLVVFGGGLALVNVPERTATRFGRVMEVAIAVGAGAIVAAVMATLVLSAGPVILRRVLPLLGIAALAAPTIAGHALAADHPAWITPVSDLVHTGSAAVWFGGLIALATMLPLAGRLASEAEAGQLAAAVVERFSRVALWAVVVMSASGLVRAITGLAEPGRLLDTAYGRTILIKTAILLVVGVVVLAARTHLVPRVVGAVGSTAGRRPAVTRFRRHLVCEVALLLALVAAVALLSELPPGRAQTGVEATGAR